MVYVAAQMFEEAEADEEFETVFFMHASGKQPFEMLEVGLYSERQSRLSAPKFKAACQKLCRGPGNPMMITADRTSENESFNALRNTLRPKRIGYHAGYPVRYYLLILLRNEGLLSAYKSCRNVLGCDTTECEDIYVGKLGKEDESKSEDSTSNSN